MKKLVLILSFALPTAALFAQEFAVTGQVLRQNDGRAVEFASVVVLEARRKARTDGEGNYQVTIPAPGEYTFIVNLPGYRTYRRKHKLSGSQNLNIRLRLAKVRGKDIIIEEQRDIQKVSRYTMTVQDMKEVPASFGDSVSALTSMPGIIRTNGFFGPLVIRGVDPQSNFYLIDDVPVMNPLHFGGLHSIISTDMMSEIDVYSSAFPAMYGSALGAIISINTIDDIKEFGGNAEWSIISTNAVLKGPFGNLGEEPVGADETGEDKPAATSPPPPAASSEAKAVKITPAGYWLVSGRYSTFELLTYIPFLSTDVVPKYYDYQVKGKYFLSRDHALTMFVFGGADKLIFVDTEEFQKEREAEGADPLLNGIEFRFKSQYHSQAAYYTYRPSRKFYNRLMIYSALNESFFFFDNPGNSDFAIELNVSSRPNIFGVKDRMKWEWWRDYAEVRLGVEARLGDFRASGTTIVPKDQTAASNPNIDLGDKSLFEIVALDEKHQNRSYGGYFENKFTWGGLTLLPGVRGDHLELTRETTINPRGMISFTFPTETTLSAAGGRYSYFLQNNPAWFGFQPEIASAKYLSAEQAIHRSAGIEQKIDLWTARVEGFYNTYSHLLETDPHITDEGETRLARNTGQQENYGVEVLLRLDRHDVRSKPALFGWLSYTHTRARRRTNLDLSSDELGDKFVPFIFEQIHSVKLVLGVTQHGHTASIQAQYYTSFPYTPIVGGTGPDSLGRYVPTNGERNSARFEPAHRLDIRYSYQSSYRWGYVKFYVEVINVTNHRQVTQETWRYDQPYQEGANPRRDPPEDLAMFPNFGVEAKF